VKNIIFFLICLGAVLFSCSKETNQLPDHASNKKTQKPEFVYANEIEDFDNYSVPRFLTQSIIDYNAYSAILGEPSFQETFGEIILNVDFTYESSKSDTVKFYMVEKDGNIDYFLLASKNKMKQELFLLSKDDELPPGLPLELTQNTPLEAFFNCDSFDLGMANN